MRIINYNQEMPDTIFPDKLYLVTDSAFYSHQEIAKRALDAGCKIIQLRYKGSSSLEFFETASNIRKIMNDKYSMFIVNDRADIALAVKADALHLGEEDLPIEYAKRICGDKMIIGLSTHNIEAAIEAQEKGAYYIGLGPVFATRTKVLKYKPIGLEVLREVRGHINIPIVAIGGINQMNARSVIEAGADAVAVSSVICHTEGVEDNIKNFLMELKKI
ncbi:thiamine phosphate synthase [bacterium]|nr:thiamine phosphate synthase [bacterium]